MNTIAPQSTAQLPAYMQALAARSQGSALLQNVSAGQAVHQIGIKGSRFRLQNPDGSEDVVPNLFLDVIVVDANSNLSKIFYIGKYNPSEEGKAPDCYSDNGVAPSQRAAKPQCGTCAECPHNVWGSAITDSGSQTKKCSDSRKMAVVLAENPTGPVYLLKIPAASIKNSRDYAEAIINRGIPIEGIITRLQFDSSADYPKVTFSAMNWAEEFQVKAVLAVAGTDETKAVIGLNDKPRVEAIAAPTLHAAASVNALPPQPVYAPAQPVQPNYAAPQPAYQPAPQQPMYAASAPQPAPQPAPQQPAGAFAQFGAPPVGQPTNAAPVPAPAKRGKGKKAETPQTIPVEYADIPAHMAHAAPPLAAQPMFRQPAFDNPGVLPAAAAVPMNPPATNAALDALLDQAMRA